MAARRRPDERRTPLARALADARIAADMLQVPVAERLGINQARLSRIEGGLAVPSEAHVSALLDLYGVHGDARERIEQMAADARAGVVSQRLVVQRGRPAAMQARWSRMIHDSHQVRAYHPALVIGAVQVPSYAAVVLDLDDAGMRERAAQADALRSHPQQRHILLHTEGALRATVGSPAVMAEQVDRLVEVSSMPNVRIGVIPAGHAMTFTCGTAFHLYEGEGFAAAVVGLEVAAAELREPDDVAHFSALHDRLAAAAVYDDQARAVLERIADDYRQQS